MTGAGSRNANAAATPSTAPATYHCHTALNCPMDANASAAAPLPTLTSTRMLTFGNSFRHGKRRRHAQPWIVKYSMKLPCENCRSPSAADHRPHRVADGAHASRLQEATGDEDSHAGCNRRERRSPPVSFMSVLPHAHTPFSALGPPGLRAFSVKRCAIQSRNRCRRSRPMAGVAPRSVSEQQRTKATRKRRRRSTRAASPIAPERSRQHTANPRCAEPTSAHGRCRSPAIRARSLQRRVRGCEPLLDVQRLLRAQSAGDVRRRRREQLLGADIAQGGAAGHPRLQGLDVAQRIGKHVEHQLERAMDSPVRDRRFPRCARRQPGRASSLKGSALGEGTDWMMRRTP